MLMEAGRLLLLLLGASQMPASSSLSSLAFASLHAAVPSSCSMPISSSPRCPTAVARCSIGGTSAAREATTMSPWQQAPGKQGSPSSAIRRHRKRMALRMGNGIAEEEGDAPTTFESVLVKDPATQQTSFSVLAPDQWPHGKAPFADTVRDVLIKPGFGWGEGTHPTTYMCLEFLAQHTKQGLSMLDYGTGSGVLAIAARRLGAGRVVGIDKDDEILECAGENAELNFGEEHGVELLHGREVVTGTRGVYLDGVSATFDVVVANMLAPALCRLAPAITSAVTEEGTRGREAGGMLALSGMRREQVGDVKAAYTAQGVTFFEERSLEGAAPGAAWAEWVLLKGRRGKMTEEQAARRAEMLSDLAVEG